MRRVWSRPLRWRTGIRFCAVRRTMSARACAPSSRNENPSTPTVETEMTAALELRGLTKRFVKPAVDQLDLLVRAGELYALLGPNGAGKTTTLRMVGGLLRPDAGTIRIFGIDSLSDPIAAKRIVAWLPDE